MRDIGSDFRKWLNLRNRNLLTDNELVLSMLLEVAHYETSVMVTFLQTIPPEILIAYRNRLDEMAEAGFNWRPILIGKSLSEDEFQQLNSHLRLLHQSLHA